MTTPLNPSSFPAADNIPSFAKGFATARDRRLLVRLLARTEEAFESGDRIDFEVFAAATACRLNINIAGMGLAVTICALRDAAKESVILPPPYTTPLPPRRHLTPASLPAFAAATVRPGVGQ